MLKTYRCRTLSLHLPDTLGWLSGAQDLSSSVYSPSLNYVAPSHLQASILIAWINQAALIESISVFTFAAVTRLFCSNVIS